MVHKKNIIVILLLCFAVSKNSFATVRSVPLDFPTITDAIAASTTGDTVRLSGRPFTETFTINKSIVLIGISQQTIINGSVTISSNNVTCKDFKVQGSSIGIVASNVSNLSLINISSYGNSDFGASLGNISTLKITGGVYSKNFNHGLSIANCTNLTMTNVVADSNGTNANIQAGIQLYAVTGTSVLTNITARRNSMHGLFIYYGSSGVTIQGGTFSNNGINQYYDGGGIAIDAGTNKTISNIVLNGPITAQNNETAGIWITASASTDSVKNVIIGQTGLITLSSNNSGGVIVYGNIHSTIITASFTKGTASAAGVLLLGTNTIGTLSPQNSIINNSTFSGYTSGNPAITLSSGTGKNSTANVSGTGNTFVGYANDAAVENVVYHKPDNAVLGIVTLTNNNPMPVELSSFTSRVTKKNVQLIWETATETNNYGFEIERTMISDQVTVNSEQSSVINWRKIGFAEGSGTTNAPRGYSFNDNNVASGKYSYRLKQIDRDGAFEYSNTISVEIQSNVVKGKLSLEAFPNPFNGMTNVVFEIPENGYVDLIVYDVSGKKVKEVFSGFLTEGSDYSFRVDASALSSGVYFCVLHHRDFFTLKKLLFIK